MSSLSQKEATAASGLLAQIERAFLPEMEQSEEFLLSGQDFYDQHKTESLAMLKNILPLLTNITDSKDFAPNLTRTKSVLVPLLLLCGEHSESSAWSSAQHIALSFKILALVKQSLKCSSIQEVLVLNLEDLSSGQILKWCLESLATKLSNPNWKSHLGAQTAFIWLLHQLTFPNLTSSVISDVLPTCLRFLDDWEIPNKLKGIRSIRHIIENSNQSEMKSLGRAELIQDALNKCLHSREVEVINTLYPTFILFTNRLGTLKPTKTDQADQLMLKLLQNMESESELHLKRAYGSQLQPLLNLLSTGKLTRWLTRLVRTVATYTAYEDPENDAFRIEILRNMDYVVSRVQEAIQPHARNTFEILVRLLYDLSSKGEEGKNKETFELAAQCFLKTAKLAPNEFRALFSKMADVKINPVFDNMFLSTLKSL